MCELSKREQINVTQCMTIERQKKYNFEVWKQQNDDRWKNAADETIDVQIHASTTSICNILELKIP